MNRRRHATRREGSTDLFGYIERFYNFRYKRLTPGNFGPARLSGGLDAKWMFRKRVKPT